MLQQHSTARPTMSTTSTIDACALTAVSTCCAFCWPARPNPRGRRVNCTHSPGPQRQPLLESGVRRCTRCTAHSRSLPCTAIRLCTSPRTRHNRLYDARRHFRCQGPACEGELKSHKLASHRAGSGTCRQICTGPCRARNCMAPEAVAGCRSRRPNTPDSMCGYPSHRDADRRQCCTARMSSWVSPPSPPRAAPATPTRARQSSL